MLNWTLNSLIYVFNKNKEKNKAEYKADRLFYPFDKKLLLA